MTGTTTRSAGAPAAPRRRRRRGRVGAVLVVVGLAGAGVVAWTRGHVADVVLHEQCTATAKGMTTTLSPGRMGNAATIAGISVKRGLPARAASIGLATAIQESKLDNLDHGDRDSLGLFQQRPSQGWGTEEEVQDPVYSSNAFYDVLVKVEGYQALEITKAAQKVQRSAYPDAYADHEDEARALASTLTGYTQAGLSCVLKPPSEGTAQEPGKDGLTKNARALASAVGAETPGRLRRPLGDEGRSLVFGSERGGERRAWSLAQWAVARASDLDIVRVRTDGREWNRDDPGAGWSRTEGPLPEGGELGAGDVLIEVAPA